MKLEVEVEGVSEMAAEVILGSIADLIRDYSREIGQRNRIDIREVK